MPCVVPPMLWSLDELKSSLLDEFPILTTSEGEGYQILLDSFVQWLLEITCLLFFRSGEFGGIWGCWGLFPPRILRNQRTPRVTSHSARISYSARILRNHRTRRAYSEIIVLDRWERIPQKSEKKRKKEKKKNLQSFFFFSAKKPWNLIIWNMGEIVVFPAFWAVAHTIAFHEIQVV